MEVVLTLSLLISTLLALLAILAAVWKLDQLIERREDKEWTQRYEQTLRKVREEQRERENGPRKLRALPYAEYLQTPHWTRKREEKLRTVGRRCQVCNQGPGPLDVHHRTYERLGEELDVDLTALCRSCHHLFHEHGRLSS